MDHLHILIDVLLCIEVQSISDIECQLCVALTLQSTHCVQHEEVYIARRVADIVFLPAFVTKLVHSLDELRVPVVTKGELLADLIANLPCTVHETLGWLQLRNELKEASDCLVVSPLALASLQK